MGFGGIPASFQKGDFYYYFNYVKNSKIYLIIEICKENCNLYQRNEGF